MPFLTESIYQALKMGHEPKAVHLTPFPVYESKLRHIALEESMSFTQTVVSLGHKLRKENKLKVRQPLAKAFLVSTSQKVLEALKLKSEIIADELNVKSVEFSENEKQFVWYSVKPNFRVLGKKVGSDMPKVQKVLAELSEERIKELLQKPCYIEVEGKSYLIEPSEVMITRETHPNIVADTCSDITIVLDTVLTDELIEEGLAREIVNKINTMRKEMGFEIIDRIHVSMDTTQEVIAAYHKHKAYIDHETLTKSMVFEKNEGTEWDLNGHKACVLLSVIA